jgi:fusion protein PurCD
MNISVIGSGAREHALIQAMSESSQGNSFFCIGTSRNPGIIKLTENYAVGDITQAVLVTEQLKNWATDLAVIGPEAPLKAGIADQLRGAGIAVFGPDRKLARIETSKSYTRELLAQTAPGASPAFCKAQNLEQVSAMLTRLGENYVIKADGLTGGKGVKVSGDHLHSHNQALSYAKKLIDSDGSCVVEEKLFGQEFSLFTITDGSTFIHLPPVQDHKRAQEGDTGPNTGGMGSYSDANLLLPFLEPRDIEQAAALNEQVVTALAKDNGSLYRGVLYGGFMAVRDGIKVIEFNARFGDPEVMNLMAVTKTDISVLFYAAAVGKLHSCTVEYLPKASVCKYAVPVGYPEKSIKGDPLSIGAIPQGCRIYFGSVDMDGETLVTAGSRTAACTAVGDTIEEAEFLVEKALGAVEGNLFHRKDIGTKALIDQRTTFMKELRS